MRGSTQMSSRANSYLVSVIAAGLAIIGYSIWSVAVQPPGLEWFILAALTLLTGSFTVKVPSLTARISVSETFVFTSTLLFGPAAGTMTVVLDALIISFWLRASSHSGRQFLFNLAAPAIAMWISSHVYFAAAGVSAGSVGPAELTNLIGPMLLFAVLYFLINTMLVARAIASERTSTTTLEIWINNFPSVSINYFVGASIAMLLVAYTPRIDFTVLSIIIPLLLISYLTFRSSMGRLEDANKHVSQLNVLYMSTVEALAMAVDAKDQITHGHIRRVQVYALELAKRLGVADQRQLRAIETAALLHDMGKLAVPEHILNKPGKLSVGEFDTMKRHADIGADLLSSIPFPYPVVPIVRYHHENWDGTGYPSRLAGTDIPLGARILSVVDCFDALTSDRPYRPRLSTEEAFSIIRDRRGTMYDPLVVDAFIDSYAEIAPAAILAGHQAPTLIREAQLPVDVFGKHAAVHGISLDSGLAAETRRELARTATFEDVLRSLAEISRRLTPASVVAIYLYIPLEDVLRCIHSSGDPNRLLDGFEMRSGERTSGWVAANLRSIANSSAALDLGGLRTEFSPALLSSLSIPLVVSGALHSVLTLYSSVQEAFSDSHKRAIEQVIALAVERIAQLPRHQSTIVKFPDVQRQSAFRS